jgi:hypothetical protein
MTTTLNERRFTQTLAEVKAARGFVDHRMMALQEEAREARLEREARQRLHRFDVSLCTGFFRHATGGQWLDVPRQMAQSLLLSMGLERVMRTDQAKYVLILRERDHTGKEIGYYECRVGSFPGIKLTDWSKELDKLHTRR